MKPGEKFRQARTHHRVTRKAVMAALKLTYDQVNHGENNKNHNALLQMIEHYAQVWGIPQSWFYDGQANPVPPPAAPKPEVTFPASVLEKPLRYQPGDTVILPLWKSVYAAADGDCWFYDEAVEQESFPALFLDAEPEKFFLAQILGSSLEDLASTGDLLLIRRTTSPGLHTLVMAQSPEGHAVCKILRPGRTQPYELHSYNKQVPNITDCTGYSFIGEVRAMLLKSVLPPRPNIVWSFHQAIRVPYSQA